MRATNLFEDRTRATVDDGTPRAVLVLPLGATEQHGDHLPTGTDTRIVAEIARRGAERATATVVVAPTLPFGISGHHSPFGGTLTLSLDVFAAALRELIASGRRAGFSRIFLLNGHGGNVYVTRAVAAEQAERVDARIAVASYWELLGEPAPKGPIPGHAGWFETSIVMALTPELVDASRRGSPTGDVQRLLSGPPWIERPGAWVELGGVSDAAEASPERGAELLEQLVVAAADAFDRLAEDEDA